MGKSDIIYDNRNTFIKGLNIILSVLTEADVINSDWYGWFNDEENTFHLQKHYYPNTLEKQLGYYRDLNNNSRIQLGIRKINDYKELVGIISLQDIDYINRNAEISLVIGDKNVKDLLVADEAMKLMLNHAFFALNLHKINVGYIETLEYWGEYLIKRFGFKKESLLREQVFKRNRYLNIIKIGLLKEEYKIKIS